MNILLGGRIGRRDGPADVGNLTELQDAIDSIDDGLMLWDADDRLVLWNRPYAAMFPKAIPLLRAGLSFEELFFELVSRNFFDLGDLEAEAFIRLQVELHRAAAGSHDLATGDGRILQIRERRTGNGGIIRLITDNTIAKRREAELRAAKDKAESANRSKSTFLANMSHELRTPLNAIIGFSDILKSESFGPLGSPKYQDYAASINDSGQHLLQLINYILDLSRVEAGRYELRRERIQPGDLIGEALRVISVNAGQAGIEITVNAPGDLPSASLDHRTMRQVLLNLLSNSVKFTPAGGRITIEAATDAEYLTIAVADTGIGIPAEDLPRLTNPFEQVGNALTKTHQGSGLGLAISKELVQLHGGELIIASELGTGTVVTLRLPLEPPAS